MDGSNRKAHILLNDCKTHFKVDPLQLRELERRISANEPRLTNDYLADLDFARKPKCTERSSLHTRAHRKSSRQSSLGDLTEMHGKPPLEAYYSDSSVSTTTTESTRGDTSDRKKRRRFKALPPLPKPIVSHSEVYFTETETETEAPKRLDPPPPPRSKRNINSPDKPRPDPKVKPKPERPRAQELNLHLTKAAARSLGVIENNKRSLSVNEVKKPVARPRSPRPITSSVYNDLTVNAIPNQDTPMVANIPAHKSNSLPLDGYGSIL